MLLTEARLHEITAALRQMSAEDFNVKPRGQKLLLINRLKDLVRIDKPELSYATAEMIMLLTHLAQREEEGEYQPVISAAFYWGFQKQYAANWQGNEEIRVTLIETAKSVGEKAHRVLATEFITFVSDKDLATLPGWSTHDLRLLVIGLLANPHCGKEADQLAELYDKINKASHKVGPSPSFMEAAATVE
jgi:hypothetical protein